MAADLKTCCREGCRNQFYPLTVDDPQRLCPDHRGTETAETKQKKNASGTIRRTLKGGAA